MKEFKEKEKKETTLNCSICHNDKIDIIQNNSKIKKIYNDIFKNINLGEFIKKCYCCNNKNNNDEKNDNGIYVHKYCILLKILFNFEIKCEKCNSIYNIKIDKKIDKNKEIYLFIIFLIIYILHLFIYLFCMFLLFINAILKEYIIISYKHIYPFFGIILFIINSIFLYFSISKNIIKCKNSIYKYTINISDITKINNKENELYKIMDEFYQWFYNQSIKKLLIKINKKFIINKLNYEYNNKMQEYFEKNNKDNINIFEDIINKKELKNKENENSDKTKDNFLDIIDFNNNKNDFNINNILSINNNNNNKIEKMDNLYSDRSNNNKEKININKSENNNIDNNLIRKKSNNGDYSSNAFEDNLKFDHKDYINININPKDSKNININIHFSSDKNSQIDFSSSKEVTFKSVVRNNKTRKTALIPKNLLMSNLISEANSFKRKRRQLKSIKIKQNKIKLQGTKIIGNIEEDEEIDFSEFDKIGSKISKIDDDNKKSAFPRNDLDLKYSNFKTKKSYKDVTLNISNSDVGGIEDVSSNQNFRLSLKNNMVGKHVHFADG